MSFLSCKTQNKINKKSRFSPSATSVSQGPHLWRKGTWLTLFDYGDRITKLSLSHGILAATKSTQSVTEQPEKVKKKKSTSFFFFIRRINKVLYYTTATIVYTGLERNYIYTALMYTPRKEERKKRTARGSRRWVMWSTNRSNATRYNKFLHNVHWQSRNHFNM